ncbi:MAG: histone deacetylase [Actinomycetota bacterium]|nr:histone deacetylase [Actinomycetota bacterium]
MSRPGLLFRHRSSLEHETGPHPENAGRIRAIERTLDDAGWPGLELIEAPLASREMLERVHDPTHVDRIERLCDAGGGMIDADTVATDASWEAAMRAAGAAASGAERLLAGEANFAFCAMRPPGHHAESDRAMGFCLFNSAAVGAAHAIATCGAGRVLILDWDVHHGNGTAEIFDARADVVYASIHQSPLYPGTGAAAEIGTAAGAGYTVNLPVPPGTGGDEFLALAEHVIAPIARSFAPSLLVISAGYDAHADDPLANCQLTTADYADLTSVMRDLGREIGAPVLVCLEGGYDPDALAASVLATVRALGDDAPARSVPVELAGAARRQHGHWAEAFAASMD